MKNGNKKHSKEEQPGRFDEKRQEAERKSLKAQENPVEEKDDQTTDREIETMSGEKAAETQDVESDVKGQGIRDGVTDEKDGASAGESDGEDKEAAEAEEATGEEDKKDAAFEEISAKDREDAVAGVPEKDWEDEDAFGEDWDEDVPPAKPWVMLLVFLGLIAAAAVICVVFWKATHADGPDDGMKDTFVEASEDGIPASGAGDATEEPDVTDAPENPNKVITQDGRVFEFTECDDIVTPKEYVNLRTEPSTAQGDATVSCMLNAGETAHRTGYSEEMGWSRVEYNGQVLYVITSYVNVVTEE